jgi:uncharacterized protein YdaU (DUF1376 family)
MPLYVSDYLGDTAHLTTLEHGTYLLLLMHAWKKDGELPAGNDRLMRIAGLSPDEWSDVREAVLEFFYQDGETLRNNRLDAELEKAHARVEAASRAGKASAKARRKKGTDVERTLNERSTEGATDRQRKSNQPQPQPHLQAPSQSNPKAGGGGKPRQDSPAPFEAVKDAYNKALPNHPTARSLTPKRIGAIERIHRRFGWSAKKWTEFFEYVAKSDFLTGKRPPSPGHETSFVANLDWLLDEDHFVRVVEGHYEDSPKSTPAGGGQPRYLD